MTTVLLIVFVVGLCWLKLHIMRVSPGHPCHDQVCRSAACPCRDVKVSR